MALISAINARQSGAFVSTGVVLSADDTIPFASNKKQLLVLTNTTGGTLTAKLDGADSTSVTVPGVGSVSVAAGLDIAVPAGQSRSVILSSVSAYCKGVVHLTGASGLTAQLFNL